MDSRNSLGFMGEIMVSSPEKKKETMEKNEENYSKWAELPDHMTEMIVGHLGFPDILRFGSVCTQWRSVSNDTRSHRSLSSYQYNPMVLFEYNVSKGNFSFFSFEEKKVYLINIEEPKAIKCVGSSQGWLIMLSPRPYLAFLLNPFTGAQVLLPILKKPGVDISKVILVTNPFEITSKSANCSCPAVSLNTSMTELSVCKLGKSWSVIKLDDHGLFIGSLIVYMGEIYVLSGIGGLWCINMESYNPRIRKCKVYFPIDLSRVNDQYEVECYLVESQESLLLVLRIKRKVPRKTVRFQIFRLVGNSESKKCWQRERGISVAEYMWERVPFLADDQVLFIGKFSSISVSTTQCQGLQGNSIYFSDDKLSDTKVPEYPEKGIYNVKTGNIGPYLPFDLYPFELPHIWITPSI